MNILHWCEKIKVLIENGANVNSLDRKGWSNLKYGCLSGQININKYLENTTPLHLSCEIGNVECISYLLQNGSMKDTKYGTQEIPLTVAD